MTTRRRTTVALGLTALAGLALAGCSGSSTSTGSSPSAPTGSAAGSTDSATAAPVTAVCDEAEVTRQVERVLTAGGAMTLTSVNEYRCAPGWAAADITAEPPTTEMILIFYDDGNGWLPAPMDVCGTSQAESRVPAELYDFACPAM